MTRRATSLGQVLVLFVLFLLVLLGVAAIGIDYASWLLVDRNLQNVSDHASLAGASEFDQRLSQENCTGGPGVAKCVDARAQAWTSLNDELGLGLTGAAIGALAVNNSPPDGQPDGTYGGQAVTFPDRIWVSTPPPSYAAYTDAGGRYSLNHGVVFVRVDRAVRSFLGGALGIQPGPRTGWSTAGALPTDFALELFCRNHIAPENGVCVNSAGLTIDGQGGIRLIRGDIGSNESLTVTSNVGGGVVVEAGNMFLVNGNCAPSSWNCPNTPPQGGISDGVTGKNAFYIAPLPVPRYASPLEGAGITAHDCAGASTSNLCVPYQDQSTSSPSSPGDWTCVTSGSSNRCGTPTVTSGSVSCIGQGGGSPQLHYYPTAISSGGSGVTPDAAHPQSNANKYRNIDDDFVAGDPDTTSPPANPAVDYLYTGNISPNGSGSTSFIVNLGQSGPRLSGTSTVRYVAFKTNNGVPDNTQNPVTLQVRLLPGSGSTAIAVDPTPRTLDDVSRQFEFTVGAGVIPAAQFNSLRLEFTFTTSGSTTAANQRGGAIAWAEIQHPDPQPAVAPMIPPGYYRSIVVPDGACAILDPTAEYSNLEAYQMPGIYRFGGSGSPNTRKIKVGDGSFLIGDGVTLVFDADWPDSGANSGVAIGANGALVLNTMRVAGTPPCTPSEVEGSSVNMSLPLLDLPYSGVCAAWAIDNSVTSGIRPGQSAWAYCDPANVSNPHCVDRGSYNPPAGYRGITFYFTPAAWPPSGITNRFEMQGGSGNDAGIAFRGVMYAPYDDVKITGGNGFNTVGQVLAWSAKFNGGSAYINLDYPYDYTPASPYLLEPTVDH